MKVLGISDGMTGGAALLVDGKVVYAIHEERLIRAKMAHGFPRESIKKVLEDTVTTPDEIDVIAIAAIDEIFREKATAYEGWLLRNQAPTKEALLSLSSVVNRTFGATPVLRQSYYGLKALLGRKRRRIIEEFLRRKMGFSCPIRFIEHHFAHACSAYFTSGLDSATVITLDGAGDNSSSHVYLVKDGCFRKLWDVDSFNSIGNYYAYITNICGFNAQRHEGKITGLAAHGEPIYADLLKRFIVYSEGSTVNKGRVFYWAAVKAIEKALPLSFRREDLAASMQQVLEEVCCAYIEHWVEQARCGDVAVAGGVFANVKLNQRVHELSKIRSIFVHPGMGDEGLAVGAAFAVNHLVGNSSAETDSSGLTDIYWGPAYTTIQMEQAIVNERVSAEYLPDIEQRLAELLAQGHVVARFNGRMEYGPRALGNRSILCQATDPSVNEWLNQRLKRSEFMPFAPVTLAEFGDQCYENLEGARCAANFMTITFDCTQWMREHCPAVVHVDGTARPQLIDQRSNPSYYRIIDEYRKITGIPCLINTSFNVHEEPIVCTPEDAIRAFLTSGLDYLAMGNYLLKQPRAAVSSSEQRMRLGVDALATSST
jgi:carbamoyltransferase